MKSYINHCIIYFAVIGFFALPFVLYIHSTGEYSSTKEVVEEQLNSDDLIIYGTALHDITSSYKNYMFSKAKAKVVALGSSRITQFREYMFSQKFYNLGTVMSSVNEGYNFLQRIIDERPDVILINVDIWWFHTKNLSPNPDRKMESLEESKTISPKVSSNDILKLGQWILRGDLSLKDIYTQLISGRKHIGIGGSKGDGFGPDGSNYYTRLVTGKKLSIDKKFKKSLRRASKGINRLEHSSTADIKNINRFVELVNKFEKHGIQVIVFFPPFAPEVNARMDKLKGKYGYIEDIKKKFMDKGLSFQDFSDPLKYGSNSCEFIDGLHGGEIIYMRIVAELAKNIPYMNDYINLDKLKKLIAQNEGLASRRDPRISNDLEIDFLDIGCKKQATFH